MAQGSERIVAVLGPEVSPWIPRTYLRTAARLEVLGKQLLEGEQAVETGWSFQPVTRAEKAWAWDLATRTMVEADDPPAVAEKARVAAEAAAVRAAAAVAIEDLPTVEPVNRLAGLKGA